MNSYFVISNITAKIDGILETAAQDSIDLATETLTNNIKILAPNVLNLKRQRKRGRELRQIKSGLIGLA